MSKKELETSLVLAATPEFIGRRVYLIRGLKVMFDSDLAELYQVPTKRLNEQVKRNIGRFPSDFAFQLNKRETQNLRSQIATSSWGGSRYTPFVFTELGVAMLSSVLNSERAIQMNIHIMRAFIKLRELLATNKDLAGKIEELERIQKEQGNHLLVISTAIKKLIDAHKPRKSAIGFQT